MRIRNTMPCVQHPDISEFSDQKDDTSDISLEVCNDGDLHNPLDRIMSSTGVESIAPIKHNAWPQHANPDATTRASEDMNKLLPAVRVLN